MGVKWIAKDSIAGMCQREDMNVGLQTPNWLLTHYVTRAIASQCEMKLEK